MPIRLLLAASAAALALALPPAHASAVTVAEVVYPERTSVGGETLALNGAGIRHRFVVRVYTAGLYLSRPADSHQAVLDAPGPKRLHVVTLRDIDTDDLGRLFTRGVADNAPRAEFAATIPGTVRMGEIFSTRRQLKRGESFSLDWVPGTGTIVRLNGEPQGAPIKEPEFYRALMGIWLGPNPADALLKDALLGKPAPAGS